MSKAESTVISKSHHASIYGGRGTQGLNVMSMPQDVVLQAHLYILNNIDEVQPYIFSHKRFIKEKFPPWVANGCWKSITTIS